MTIPGFILRYLPTFAGVQQFMKYVTFWSQVRSARHLPVVETILIDSADPAPHSGGEPAIITMGAVIANAV